MAATHLIHHSSGYIFRYCIPPDIQPFIKKRELRYSLKTGSLRCAKARANVMVSFISAVISDIRDGGPMSDVTASRINSQFRDNLKETTGQGRPKSAFQIHQRPHCPELTEKARGKVTKPRLSKVLRRYCKEAVVSGQWSPKSAEEITSSIKLFLKVMGDRAIGSIDKTDLRRYKEVLMKLPTNLGKHRQFKGKSIPEILAMASVTGSRTMSAGTINKLVGRLRTFFNFALNHGYMLANPAVGMQISIKKRPDEFRDAFDTEDLKALFGSKEYRQDGFKRGHQFWVPIIALYTGCRIEEICQLHLDDIRQEDGLWILDINDDKEKKLKNLSSKRLVPLHPVLVDELKLPDYAGSLRAKGHTRLFPDLKLKREGYSQNVSKWFGKYRKRCGVGSPKKTFHSFRHTFITAMKHKVDNISVLHELHGHALEGMTMARYGKKYPPRVLYDEAVSKLEYPLDWGYLKGSRWVPRG